MHGDLGVRVVDVYVACRADGQGVVAAIYRSKDDANKAVARIQALWGTLASLLQGAPATNIYDEVEHMVG